MDEVTASATVLACQLGAFTAAQQERYQVIRQQLVDPIAGIEESPDGYALRFVFEPSLLLTLAEFILLERVCCRFLNLALEVEPEDGPIWLRLTGATGVKEFLQNEFNLD